MALTYSPETPGGTLCPEFQLTSVDGKEYSLKDFARAKVLVVGFICNHCPYVQALEKRIYEQSTKWGALGVQFVGICANDPSEYPEDSPAELLQRWKSKNGAFPYLVDDTQEVARRFEAVCTPDFFVFGHDRRLAYRGRWDDNWRDEKNVKRFDLGDAVNALLSGEKISDQVVPSMGCSIKWRNPK